jgi:hypothetical protein
MCLNCFWNAVKMYSMWRTLLWKRKNCWACSHPILNKKISLETFQSTHVVGALSDYANAPKNLQYTLEKVCHHNFPAYKLIFTGSTSTHTTYCLSLVISLRRSLQHVSWTIHYERDVLSRYCPRHLYFFYTLRRQLTTDVSNISVFSVNLR